MVTTNLSKNIWYGSWMCNCSPSIHCAWFAKISTISWQIYWSCFFFFFFFPFIFLSSFPVLLLKCASLLNWNQKWIPKQFESFPVYIGHVFSPHAYRNTNFNLYNNFHSSNGFYSVRRFASSCPYAKCFYFFFFTVQQTISRA